VKPFAYAGPETLDQALALLSAEADARLLAGGTDLLGAMKRGISAPPQLVNLKSVPGLDAIRREADGTLSIGALARLSDIVEHPLVVERYPLLVQAIQQTATPQVRSVGTLGGNLCQRPRCWYYRHPDFPCARRRGEGCFAVGGRNRYHAIFGGSGCFIVHPSDAAPALIALDARVQIAGPDGSRTLPLAEFFIGPDQSLTQENALAPAEILTQVQLPAPPAEARGVYLKAAERRASDFALASVAAHLAWKNEQVTRARIVLGGVAPVPWRVPHAEALLLDQELSDETVGRACAAAVEGARPMRHNAFKIPLVRGLLKKALHRLCG